MNSISSKTAGLFTLKPAAQRERIPKFVYPKFKREKDDTYIYYLAWKWSLVVTAFLAALNWISYAFGIEFNFGLFEIAIPREGFIDAFAWSFPFYTGPILFLTLLPYYLLLLRRHIDPKKYDLLWWNQQFSSTLPRRKGKIISLYLWALTIGVGLIPSSFGLPLVLIEYGALSDSTGTFLLTTLLYIYVYPYAVSCALISIAVLWRYIGPYEGI